MLSLIQFLEEIERNHQAVVVPRDEVERLAQRFGAKVRGMDVWNKTGDGSVGNIIEAASTLDSRVLAEAVEQLKSPEQFTDMLNKSSAVGSVDRGFIQG